MIILPRHHGNVPWCGAALYGTPVYHLQEQLLFLGLEEQKLTEGKELIRYFCIPCKATKVNGGRTRNLPQYDMAKWEMFKKYNQRDVEVEMSIQDKLRNFPVPDFVWEEYHLDQEINDRGIALDMDVVANAIAFDEKSKAVLSEKMKELTVLENLSSIQQMKEWTGNGQPWQKGSSSSIKNCTGTVTHSFITSSATYKIICEKISGDGKCSLP